MIFIQIYIFIYGILGFVNDIKILNIYNNLTYNWNKEPIKSIKLIRQNNDDYGFTWKNNFLKLEKLENFNYLDIYQNNNNNKICGKDSYGNNLYFPENVECPINNILISESNEDLDDYVKLQLKNDIYLYYTNTSIEGKIVVDLIINKDSNIPLNPKGKSNSNYNSLSFYDEIDNDLNKEYLYSIYYLGINPISISNTKIIKKFHHKFKVYKNLSISKFAALCFEFLITVFSVLLFIDCHFRKCCEHKSYFENLYIGSIISFIIIKLGNIIILIINFVISIKYIINFIYKINSDLEKEKYDFIWNILAIINFF